jgi:biopolymer transport protein ExbD
MASRFHRSRQRRAERGNIMGHGNLNLVPLVDILTSIVFFSLLTYTGAALAALTAFDLVLPPTVITAIEGRTQDAPRDTLNLLLAVRIQGNGLLVEHSEQGGFKEEIRGTNEASLDRLQALMQQIRQQYPQNEDVLVVPDDATSYERVIQVLDRLRIANFTGISLGSRARATEVASAAAREAR